MLVVTGYSWCHGEVLVFKSRHSHASEKMVIHGQNSKKDLKRSQEFVARVQLIYEQSTR